jgi:hypothetical protein
MRNSLILAIAVALTPLSALAQGVPPSVVTDVVRQSGAATTDSIRSNQELIDKEQQDKAGAPPSAAPMPQPQQPLPQPPATSAPR